MKRLPCACLVILIALPAFSAECFDEKTARKMLAALEVGEADAARLAVCDQALEITRRAIREEQAKAAALEKDKAALAAASDKYRGLAEQGNEALAACETSKPSRLTWFALGAASALLAIIGGAAATR